MGSLVFCLTCLPLIIVAVDLVCLIIGAWWSLTGKSKMSETRSPIMKLRNRLLDGKLSFENVCKSDGDFLTTMRGLMSPTHIPTFYIVNFIFGFGVLGSALLMVVVFSCWGIVIAIFGNKGIMVAVCALLGFIAFTFGVRVMRTMFTSIHNLCKFAHKHNNETNEIEAVECEDTVFTEDELAIYNKVKSFKM